MLAAHPPVGHLLRDWRQRRRLSQLALALEADVSTRHLSFLETGRAHPSREMLLHLAEQLDVPLRARNELLLAAGYAPLYPERPLADPALAAARQAVELVLAGHEPFPALAVDRAWTLVAANRPVALFLAGIAPSLLQPPVNVVRVTFHPDGLAPRIANLAQIRRHTLERLHRQLDLTADPALAALLDELSGYPVITPDEPPLPGETAGVVVPLRLRTEAGLLSFFTTMTIFGSPLDVTLAEIAIESFFPADATTADVLRRLAESPPP